MQNTMPYSVPHGSAALNKYYVAIPATLVFFVKSVFDYHPA
ncbi:MAG: hypothetical protein ACR2O3_06555 [Rhizobiaceae bacterium]